MSLSPPLVLTLKLDAIAFHALNELRKRHFPPNRNLLPAHITLFHALPGDQEPLIHQTLQSLTQRTSVLQLLFSKLRFLGKGVAVEVDCPELVWLHEQLADTWADWLTRQDQQKYRPHVTLQNKVMPDQARQLYDELSAAWQPMSGCGEGLMLWYYKGGPWELAEEFSLVER